MCGDVTRRCDAFMHKLRQRGAHGRLFYYAMQLKRSENPLIRLNLAGSLEDMVQERPPSGVCDNGWQFFR